MRTGDRLRFRPAIALELGPAVSVQTAAPFGDNPGAITVGFYSVHDDVVVTHDEA